MPTPTADERAAPLACYLLHESTLPEIAAAIREAEAAAYERCVKYLLTCSASATEQLARELIALADAFRRWAEEARKETT